MAGQDIAEIFFNVSRHKLITIRNVPPLEFINCSVNKNEKKNRILYIGLLSRKRGIKEMVEAMNYVNSNVNLLLVGSFNSPDFEREIRKIANEKVKFVDQVPYKDIPDFIKTAKIGLICFYPEPNHLGALSGRNNKIYEYMAGGLAIIASNLPTWKEIIEGRSFGITVNPKSPRDIASAVDYLLDNPEVLNQMSENGFKAFNEIYNWDIEKEKFLQAYSRLYN